MGKDKKAKKAEKKARVNQKTEKKAAQKEKRSSHKAAQSAVDSDAEDVDLDAVLAEYARQQERFLKVTETVCEPPKPARSSSTILASPSNENELFIFGGELFNGSTATFFNDLYVYNVNRDEWKLVTSPNTPLPRSGHSWCRGGNAGGIYLFGGEFSSPKQGTFYHYNDFWRLDPVLREWTRLEGRGKGPSARSGHRMTYFKNYIILFGGFQDTSQQTRYLSDLWIYDCANYAWHEPKLPVASGKPDARSSFSLLPHESGAVLYGGYSRSKSTGGSNARSSQPKGSKPHANKALLKPVIHQDTWFLRVTPPPADAPSGALPVVRWERRKRPVNTPNPPRTGGTMCAHKGRGVQFGGVHDVEESEEGIDSEFFNQLYTWNIDRNRFFPLALRRPRAPPKRVGAERGRRDRGKEAEEELLRNLRALEMKHVPGDKENDTDDTVVYVATEEILDNVEREEKPVIFEMPHPRFNAQLAVQDDVLYIFGGTFEKGDREFTFDEMWAIDLGKLDGVREIYRREPEDWFEDEDDDSDDDEDEDEEDEDVMGSEDGDRAEAADVHEGHPRTSETARKSAADETAAPSVPTITDDEAEDSDDAEPSASGNPALPHPRPFESLRAFYARTTAEWQEIVLHFGAASDPKGDERDSTTAPLASTVNRFSPKEVKKLAFERAEIAWWDAREEIMALEDEQSEAGIGDVVSLADKAGEAGKAGRRK